MQKDIIDEHQGSFDIVSFSDAHWGACDPEELYKELYESVFKTIIEKKPNMVAITGDYFHKDLKLGSLDSKFALQFFSNLVQYCDRNEIHMRILQGTITHDVDMLDILELFTINSKYCKVIKTLTFETIETLSFVYIPEEYPQDEKLYYAELYNNKFDVALGHGTFKFAANSIQISETEKSIAGAPIFDDVWFNENVRLTIFGHIHGHCSSGNVHYNGSTSRLAHGEEDDKGFLYTKLYFDDVDCHFIKNELAPIYKKIPIEIILSKFPLLPDANETTHWTRICHILNKQFEKFKKIKLSITKEDQISSLGRHIIRSFFADNPMFQYEEKIKQDETELDINQILSKQMNSDVEQSEDIIAENNDQVKMIIDNPAAIMQNINIFNGLIGEDAIPEDFIKLAIAK